MYKTNVPGSKRSAKVIDLKITIGIIIVVTMLFDILSTGRAQIKDIIILVLIIASL